MRPPDASPLCGDQCPHLLSVTCDRSQGHKESHRGYVEQHDDVVFWPLLSDAARIHALELRIFELEAARTVPGQRKCDACGLVIYTQTMDMATGNIGIAIVPPDPEPCPNGCQGNNGPAMLRGLTWQEQDATTTANLMGTWDALEQLLELSNHYAELLNMHDGGERFIFDHPGEWRARIETAAADRTRQRPPSLLAQIQDEMQNHRACQPKVLPASDPWLATAQVIGFHRGLHFVREILMGTPAQGAGLEGGPSITRGQAVELAAAIVELATVAGITTGRQPATGPEVLHLADCLRAELEQLRRQDNRTINPRPPAEDVGGLERKGI